MRIACCLILLLLGCQKKQPEVVETSSTPDTVTAKDAFEKENNYDYREFFGVYDHESTTKGFTAILSLRENGNDVYFNVSVAQGGCTGETEGVILMVEHTEQYYAGFYESDNCRLQFTMMLTDKKVDIKEITVCKLLGASCSYEGTYIKRKT